jgi:hypothetical protein
MTSFARLSRLASLSLISALAACGGAAASSGGTGPAPVAATNTSIAAARALAVGESVDVALPCDGALYFGPFDFTAEPQTVRIATVARSSDGAQICGGGAWVDGAETFSAAAGTGCIEDASAAEMESAYEYFPSSGGNAINPVYLKLEIADPRPETCPPTQLVTLTRTE